MTIIKVSKDGKAILKKKADESFIPLAPESTEEAERTVHIDVLPSTRTRRCVNIFLLMLALMVLAAGIIGGVYLYKYMIHRHRGTHLKIEYQETMPKAQTQMGQPRKDWNWCGTVMEDVEIKLEEEVEKIEVPKFDECKSSVIIHDFHKNLSVIVDNDDKECFIMELDRKTMSPPKTFADLIAKYSRGYYMPKVEVVRRDYKVVTPKLTDLAFAGNIRGYYMPKVEVVRRDYKVVTPKLTDLAFAGNIVRGECLGYDTYRLEKKTLRPKFFEVHPKLTKVYGYSDLTLYQTTTFQGDPLQKLPQITKWLLIKIGFVYNMAQKILRQKEKLLVFTSFFFCLDVFTSLFYCGRQNQVLFGKGLRTLIKDQIYRCV